MRKALALAAIAGLVAMPAPALGSDSGTLTWKPCKGEQFRGFECATHSVPRDWNDPGKGTWDLAVIRHKSSGTATQRIGSLFFNPGGPGASGVDTTPGVWQNMPKKIKQRFDVVSWDPRGVGRSNPMADCTMTPEMTVPDTGPVDWDAVYSQLRETAAQTTDQCMRLYPDHYPYVGTNQVVRDLDSLREAVGDSRLTFWGASYGSRIGYTYQVTFPNKVRAILLDGNVNPNGSLQDFASGYGGGVDNALKLYAQYHPGTLRQITRINDAAADKPLDLGGGAVFNRWSTGVVVDAFLRQQAAWPQLAASLDLIETAFFGKGSKGTQARRGLQKLVREFGLGNPVYGVPSLAAAVNCIDYADRPTAAEQNAAARGIRRQSPLRGWFNYAVMAAECEGFRPAADPVPTDFGVVSSKRVLLSGATRDPATPYAWMQSMARAMKNSRVVTYVGTQHIVYRTTPSTCVNKPLTRFFLTVEQPPRDIACPTVLAE